MLSMSASMSAINLNFDDEHDQDQSQDQKNNSLQLQVARPKPNISFLSRNNTLSPVDAFKKTASFSSVITVSSLIGNLGLFANMIIIANINQNSLAAGGLIDSSQNLILSIPFGSLSAIGSLVAKEYNLGNYDKVNSIFTTGAVFSALIATSTVPFALTASYVFKSLNQPPELLTIVQDYFQGYAWGIPGFSLLTFEQQIALGTLNTLPVGVSTFSHSSLTAALGYVLTYGKLGAPALGSAGIGHAHSISAWLNFIGLSIYLRHSPRYKDFSFLFLRKIDQDIFKTIAKIGIPVGMQIGTELLTLFILASMIGGFLGKNELAAHQLAVQYIFLVLVPIFGVRSACSILVSQKAANEKFSSAKKLANASMLLGIGLSTIALILFSAIPELLMSPFIDVDDPNNTSTIDMTRYLLIAAGVTQIFDTLRLLSGGALQGAFKDTSFSMKSGILTISGIGVPLAYALGIPANLGVIGIHVARGAGTLLGGVASLLHWHQKIEQALKTSNNTVSANTHREMTTIVSNQRISENLDSHSQAPLPLTQKDKQLIFSGLGNRTQAVNRPTLQSQKIEFFSNRCNIL